MYSCCARVVAVPPYCTAIWTVSALFAMKYSCAFIVAFRNRTIASRLFLMKSLFATIVVPTSGAPKSLGRMRSTGVFSWVLSTNGSLPMNVGRTSTRPSFSSTELKPTGTSVIFDRSTLSNASIARYSVHGAPGFTPTFLPSKSFGRLIGDPCFTAKTRAESWPCCTIATSGMPCFTKFATVRTSLTEPALYWFEPMSRMLVESVVKSQEMSTPSSL